MTPLVGQPVAGFYSCRLAKHGPPVAVRIWHGRPIVDGEELDRSPRWCVELDGETDRVIYEDGMPIGRAPLELFDEDDIWIRCCGTPVDEKEYRFLLRRKRWAIEHDPDHPAANPREAIDVRKLKPAW